MLVVGVGGALGLFWPFFLTFPFALALAVLASDPVVFCHVPVDFCFQLMDHYLHLRPFEVKLGRLFFRLILDFQQFFVDRGEVVAVVGKGFLLALGLLGSAFLGFFKFQLQSLLGFVQLFDFVFEVQDVEIEVLILVFEFFYIWRVLPSFLQVLYFLVLQLQLAFQLHEILLQPLQTVFESLFHLIDDPLVVLDHLLNHLFDHLILLHLPLLFPCFSPFPVTDTPTGGRQDMLCLGLPEQQVFFVYFGE